MSELGDYLAAARFTAWEPAIHDCCAFPAQWARVPLPAYGTDAEGEAMVRAAGGLLPLWERAAEGSAVPVEPGEVEPGDVGIIELLATDLTMVEVGAIWTGRRWAFVPRGGGIAAVSTTCLKAWRPLCLKP